MAGLIALPWLVETHVEPWTMFYPDALMAVATFALLVWVLIRSPAGLTLTALSLGVAGVCLVPVLQTTAGLIAFPAEGALAALYLIGFMLAIIAGHRVEVMAPGRAADALFTGLAVAAFASVGLQLYQWFDFDALGVLVLKLPVNGRPFANVGQPNLLATLHAWGLVALWWAYERKAVGIVGAVTGAMFLLLGIAMTQSRTGWLEVALLAGVALVRPQALVRCVSRTTVALLAVYFVFCVVALPNLGSVMGIDPMRDVANQTSAGRRPEIWRLGIEAIVARPWFGWGWNQGGEAHVALAAQHASIQVLVPYMHNLAIDLLLWNGIPIGALALLSLTVWFTRRWRDATAAEPRLLLLALAVLVLHAMLELPHGHALFLLPAGLMMGMVDARSRARALCVVPRWAAGVVTLGMAAALALLVRDMQVAEHDLLALRMRAARIANLPPLGPAPQLWLMAPFGELLANLRAEPTSGMDGVSLDEFRRVAYHFPSTGNLLRLAEADALNGRPEDARQALLLLCLLTRPALCERAGQYWAEIGRKRYPELAATWPVAPRPTGASVASWNGLSR